MIYEQKFEGKRTLDRLQKIKLSHSEDLSLQVVTSSRSRLSSISYKIRIKQDTLLYPDRYLKHNGRLRDSFMKFLIKPNARGRYRGPLLLTLYLISRIVDEKIKHRDCPHPLRLLSVPIHRGIVTMCTKWNTRK